MIGQFETQVNPFEPESGPLPPDRFLQNIVQLDRLEQERRGSCIQPQKIGTVVDETR